MVETKDKKKNSTFSQNLKYFRKKKGISQYELADLTGLSQRMIAHYETVVSQPPIDKVEIIAIALGLKTSDLLNSREIQSEDSININDFDTKSLKKLKDILSLPPNDRSSVYRLINSLLRKNQLEMKEKLKSFETSKK
jgi:transcriptional regulator with XRE-family HTH domain